MNYSNRYFIINSWLLNSNIIIFGWHILIAKCLTFSILSQCNSNRTKLLQTHNNKVGSWNYQPLLLLNGIFFSFQMPNIHFVNYFNDVFFLHSCWSKSLYETHASLIPIFWNDVMTYLPSFVVCALVYMACMLCGWLIWSKLV